MRKHTIYMEVENSPTILQKIIQIIKRRRIDICRFYAEAGIPEINSGRVKIIIDTDLDSVRLLKTQLEKQIDVMKVF